jgi:hypothetical protein
MEQIEEGRIRKLRVSYFIIKVMNAYPSMEIQLSAFADCRGSLEYNKTLSENSARATLI